MILLDTNVVSELLKPSPHQEVAAWINTHYSRSLFLSSVTVAELLFGVAILPNGKRKWALAASVDGLVALYVGRILPFDTIAATTYGSLAAKAQSGGKGLPMPDGYIAAIAAAHGLAVATRDESPFLAANLTVIDPWKQVV
jgi:predicted nucleic acid-binding protein